KRRTSKRERVPLGDNLENLRLRSAENLAISNEKSIRKPAVPITAPENLAGAPATWIERLSTQAVLWNARSRRQFLSRARDKYFIERRGFFIHDHSAQARGVCN